MEKVSHSLSETASFAADLLKRLGEGNRTAACVVALHGELGSGKTAFVQAIAKALGVREHVTSPTFVIMKNYQLKAISYKLLVHIDAYRLTGGAELHALGFRELLKDPGNLIMIEWPEHISDALPRERMTINFEFVDDSTRRISGERT